MQRSIIHSAVLVGIKAHRVTVSAGYFGTDPEGPFAIKGAPDGYKREAQIRVKQALMNVGMEAADLLGVTVEVLDAPPQGSFTGTDLAIALAVWGLVHPKADVPPAAYAELSLGGDVRAVRGTVAAAHLLGPDTVTGEVHGAGSLFAYMLSEITDPDKSALRRNRPASTPDNDHPDFSDVRGWTEDDADRLVAAVRETLDTGRPLLLRGDPGSGKTMVARRLAWILPALTDPDEEQEIAEICDAAGLGYGIRGVRPFRAPHHTTSAAGLIGGGTGNPRPGEVTLAHGGVLFLDEIGDFSRMALESLRHALKSGEARLSRAWGTVTLPAKPLLTVMAWNADGDLPETVASLDPITFVMPKVDPTAPQGLSSAEMRKRLEAAGSVNSEDDRRVWLKAAIRICLDDERTTVEILTAALGVLEGVTDSCTFNPGEDLIDVYDEGRALGARLPGGCDRDEEEGPGRWFVEIAVLSSQAQTYEIRDCYVEAFDEEDAFEKAEDKIVEDLTNEGGHDVAGLHHWSALEMDD